MREGMLWYDSENQKGIKEKIAEAVDFFQTKYGYLPCACYVNPQSLNGELSFNTWVKVESSERIIKNHIWLEFPQD